MTHDYKAVFDKLNDLYKLYEKDNVTPSFAELGCWVFDNEEPIRTALENAAKQGQGIDYCEECGSAIVPMCFCTYSPPEDEIITTNKFQAPAGWVLVPREPTQKMMNRAYELGEYRDVWGHALRRALIFCGG